MTRDDETEDRETGDSQDRAEAAEVGELQPDDFYMDGEFLVFTAQYHLRRGYCCNSDCRNCPYK